MTIRRSSLSDSPAVAFGVLLSAIISAFRSIKVGKLVDRPNAFNQSLSRSRRNGRSDLAIKIGSFHLLRAMGAGELVCPSDTSGSLRTCSGLLTKWPP